MTTFNNTADRSNFMGKNTPVCRIAGFASVAVATGLAVHAGKEPASIVMGAAVGSAYAYLVGGLADSIAPLTSKPMTACLAVMVGAGSFCAATGMMEVVESLATTENNSTEALF